MPKEQALKTAYLMALTKSVANLKDENIKRGVNGIIVQTQKELDEMRNVKGEKSEQVKK